MSIPWLWLAVPAALLLTGVVLRRMGEAGDAARSTPPGELVDIGGRRLHLLRKGSGGPSIVLEAGGGFSSSMWWPLQDKLAARSTVISYDRAGLGWSDPAPLPRSLEDRAADLSSLLAKAHIPAPYLMVALSYGGPLVRLFAQRHPGLVAGIVFVDIAHEAVFSATGAQTYVRRSSAMLRIIGRLAQIGVFRLLRLRGMPLPSTALPFTPSQRRALDSRFATAHSFFAGADEFASMLGIAKSMDGLNIAGSLGNIPIAVISHGKPFPGPFAVLETNHLKGQQQLAELSNNSMLVIAEHSGHGVPLEEPALVIDVIERVMNAIGSGTLSAT